MRKVDFLFVGMQWWGISVIDMAESMEFAGRSAGSVALWDLGSRIDRRLMDGPVSSLGTDFRVACRSRNIAAKYVVIVPPHRMTLRSMARIRDLGEKTIALLGDRPVGKRQVEDMVWSQFDSVVVADRSWLSSIPEGPMTVVEPWGSTLAASEFLSREMYVPRKLAIIGAPYEARISVARRLAARYPISLQGDGWSSMRIDGPEVTLRPSDSREATIRSVRANAELVINVQHEQFQHGVNPQFFDYAAAGIPQVVIYADALEKLHLGYGSRSVIVDEESIDLLGWSEIVEYGIWTSQLVRGSHMFYHSMERALVR